MLEFPLLPGGERPPVPIADRSYSGTFTVRTSPRVHRLASRPRSRASRRALGVFELPDDLRVLDLDDPAQLVRLRLRPTQVVTRNLTVPQGVGASDLVGDRTPRNGTGARSRGGRVTARSGRCWPAGCDLNLCQAECFLVYSSTAAHEFAGLTVLALREFVEFAAQRQWKPDLAFGGRRR